MTPPYTVVGHEGLLLWNPLPEVETFALVDYLDVPATARVLDVGCGRAEMLLRLLERTGARGVGVESSPDAMALARAAAAGRVDPARIAWRQERFDETQFDAASFDVVLCVGSTHAVGGLRPTLAAMRRLLVAGGTALVGEGLWLREPDAEYLAFLGDPRDALLDAAGNVAAARDAGFEVVRALVSSKEDFDRYEERHAAQVERFAAERPGDSDAAEYVRRSRAWRAAALRWGRDTLGFALYELRRGR